jgi:hypothetical protein
VTIASTRPSETARFASFSSANSTTSAVGKSRRTISLQLDPSHPLILCLRWRRSSIVISECRRARTTTSNAINRSENSMFRARAGVIVGFGSTSTSPRASAVNCSPQGMSIQSGRTPISAARILPISIAIPCGSPDSSSQNSGGKPVSGGGDQVTAIRIRPRSRISSSTDPVPV